MIREFREAVYQQLVADLPPKSAIYPTIPDDLGSMPAVVVGRPTINVSDQLPGAWDLDLTVYVIGHRVSAISNQNALDDKTAEVLASLDTGNIKTTDVVEARVQSITPALTQVAGVDYPCYMVSLVGTSTICR